MPGAKGGDKGGGPKDGGGGGKGGGGKSGGGSGRTLMTKDAAARIQSAEARQHGGQVEKGSFASRAQSAADRNANADAQSAYGDSSSDYCSDDWSSAEGSS